MAGSRTNNDTTCCIFVLRNNNSVAVERDFQTSAIRFSPPHNELSGCKYSRAGNGTFVHNHNVDCASESRILMDSYLYLVVEIILSLVPCDGQLTHRETWNRRRAEA